MRNIRHIFFDLDHTLWDHDANARKVLLDLYAEFDLVSRISVDLPKFLKIYTHLNHQLWDDYNHGRIERDYLRNERFRLVLEACGTMQTADSIEMSDYFLHHCPRQGVLIDGADVILNYLVKKYEMSIITNGFEDVQEIKLKTSGLNKYFKHVFTSESIGSKKPDPAIFEHAMKVAGVKNDEVVMIGDNLKADVGGALNAQITPIYFNPLGTVKSDCQWQISHLSELMKIL
ncbi:MAG: putative hydrolase of the HAD superfamily [Cyclobacteriaceae bacterium]|jgi:putative hydrolase of the HAD superfamily